MSLAEFAGEKGIKSKSDAWKRYIGPVAVLVTVLLVWSLVINPFVMELRADLAFLRAARIQAIQQQIQQSQQGQKPADAK